VIPIGKDRLQPFHPIGQIALGSPDDQIKVIGHHTIPFQNPTAFLTGLEKALLKRKMRPLVDKQVPAVVPTVDHIVNSVFLLDS
jgi:hypothetical protein